MTVASNSNPDDLTPEDERRMTAKLLGYRWEGTKVEVKARRRVAVPGQPAIVKRRVEIRRWWDRFEDDYIYGLTLIEVVSGKTTELGTFLYQSDARTEAERHVDAHTKIVSVF